MNSPLRFGISVLLGFVAWGLVTAGYLWPALRTMPGRAAFRPILLLHAFRFVGLAFLVPGVVAPDLPVGFARPAAYGDLIASLLALVALGVLSTRIGAAFLWTFNLWGTADLLFAIYQGQIGARIEPGQLGAMYFVPTVLVPLLLITHGLVFWMLLRPAPTVGLNSRDDG
jgi:hypothetical protein